MLPKKAAFLMMCSYFSIKYHSISKKALKPKFQCNVESVHVSFDKAYKVLSLASVFLPT